MGTRNIYLVIGNVYDSSTVLAAFEAKRDAEKLRERCAAYEDAERPRRDPWLALTNPANDHLHAEYWKKYERWGKKHPGGPNASAFHEFAVQRIRLQ